MIAILGALTIAGFVGLGVWVFGFTPEDANMGFVQKIMYIHIPSILAAYLAAFLVAYCSVGYLWKRAALFDRVARAAAEQAVLFFGLTLVTGAVWGRPTWGTYWTWDARLTSTLLAFVIFVGYLMLRQFAAPGEKQARLAAVIGIIAFLDIPLIHVSVQWWRTLHQPSTLFKAAGEGAGKPAADPELLYPLFFGMAVMLVCVAFLMLYRLRSAMLEEELGHRLGQR